MAREHWTGRNMCIFLNNGPLHFFWRYSFQPSLFTAMTRFDVVILNSVYSDVCFKRPLWNWTNISMKETMNCHKDMLPLLCIMGCTAVSAGPFSILALFAPSLLARPWLLPLSHTWPTDWPQLEAQAGTHRHFQSGLAATVEIYCI